MKISKRERAMREKYYKKYGIRYDDAYMRTTRICQMLIRKHSFSRIMDAAGFFPTAHVLADHYPQAKVTIYNLYKETDILTEFYSTIDHVQGDLTRMPFEDNSFDCVFLGEVIEHIYDLGKALSEVKRVLKPNGILALTTPNLAAWFNRIVLLFGKCPVTYHPAPIQYNPTLLKRLRKTYGNSQQREFALHHFHIRVFTVPRLIDYLELKGFKVLHYRVYNCSTPDRRWFMLRKVLGSLLPPGARENIGLVACNNA